MVAKGYSVIEAAQAMSVGKSSMDKWVSQLRQERNGITSKTTPLTPDQLKIRELEKRIKRIEEEKEILKNCLPYASAPIKIETRDRLYYDLNLESSRSLFGDFISR